MVRSLIKLPRLSSGERIVSPTIDVRKIGFAHVKE